MTALAALVPQPLLADGWGDLIGGGATVAVFVIWVLIQAAWKVMTAPKQPGGPGNLPKAKRPVLQPGAGRNAPPDPLAELQAFLRRAQQLAEGKEPVVAERVEEVPPPIPGQRGKRTKKRPPARPPLANQPPEAGPLEEGPRRGPRAPLGTEIRQHVQQHLDSDPVGRRGKSISQIDQSKRQFEAQIHRDMDHSVGRLSTEMPSLAPVAAVAPTEPPPAVAGSMSVGLTNMLHDPGQLRMAIVLLEVLRRPEERWGTPPAAHR